MKAFLFAMFETLFRADKRIYLAVRPQTVLSLKHYSVPTKGLFFFSKPMVVAGPWPA